MCRYIFVIVLLAKIGVVYGQNAQVDSLSQELKRATSDTTRINLLNAMSIEYVYINPAVAKDDVDIALSKSREINFLKGEATALNVLGGINWAEGDYPQSLNFYLSASEIFEKLHDRLGVS
ncbi:hypothetical protein E1176_13935, partial [Fulvivirga sp. RKSG066]|nr:hypothetical protein [Fulvivirga aurantia]